MKKQQLNCKILEHIEIIKDNFYLKLEWENAINLFRPAQFVEIETTKNTDPLLRRPFSVFNATDNSITIAYKKLGKGTLELAKRQIGETINIIGPLGNFYPIHQIKENQKIIIVGGGTGLASVHYLAKHLDMQNLKYILIVGFRSECDIFCKTDLQNLKGNVIITTNDGSVGEKGLVTDVQLDFENSMIFACGPNVMIKALQNKLKDIQHCQIFASLEEYMGCGLGLCNGCVVKIKADNKDGFEFKKVCKNGPVFNVEDVIWK